MERHNDNSVLDAIREHIKANPQPNLRPPAALKAISDAEASLGFPVPPLLRSLYLEVGNGGFGPGYGIIGVEGGHASNLGTLVSTLNEILRGAEYLGLKWKNGLVPFCEWGCNIFSCIDCNHETEPLFLSEECVRRPQQYDLGEFFRMWIAGTEILDADRSEMISAEIIDPFTRKKTKVSGRRPKD